MKAVMISIKPKWCELIAKGQKTIEVRKTKPKIKTPFKCYIYETKGIYKSATCNIVTIGLGKVIGEFVCDGFYTMKHCGYDNCDVKLRLVDEDLHYLEIDGDFLNKCRLSHYDIEEYSNGRDFYGWHISDLVIYDKPRELCEFRKAGALSYDDWLYGIYNGTSESSYERYLIPFTVTRPPQSWYYVEELNYDKL